MTAKLLLKQLIVTGASLVIATTLVLFVLMPAWRNLTATQSQAKELGSQVSDARNRLNFLKLKEADKEKITTLNDKALTYLPENTSQSNLILQLHEMGKAAQVTIDKITISSSVKDSVQFNLEINGSYQATLQFVKNLNQALRANLVTKIDLSSTGTGQDVKTTIEGNAFFKLLPKDLTFAGQKLLPETKVLEELTHFGEPIKPDEIPGGSSEPFGSL